MYIHPITHRHTHTHSQMHTYMCVYIHPQAEVTLSIHTCCFKHTNTHPRKIAIVFVSSSHSSNIFSLGFFVDFFSLSFSIHLCLFLSHPLTTSLYHSKRSNLTKHYLLLWLRLCYSWLYWNFFYQMCDQWCVTKRFFFCSARKMSDENLIKKFFRRIDVKIKPAKRMKNEWA